MGIMQRTLPLLFPRGSLWRFIGSARLMLEGIAYSLDRAHEVLRAAQDEAIPGSADATLEEWCRTLAIKYDATIPRAKLRNRLVAMWTAARSSTPAGLAYQIAKEYAGLTVTETAANAFAVSGIVESTQDALRVGAIVARYAPLHLQPTVLGYTASPSGNDNPVPADPASEGDSSILSKEGSARCGLATCGLGICGYDAAS